MYSYIYIYIYIYCVSFIRSDDASHADESLAASKHAFVIYLEPVALYHESWAVSASLIRCVTHNLQPCASRVCIHGRLVESNHPDILGEGNANLGRIISIFSMILETELCDQECANKIKNILVQVTKLSPEKICINAYVYI
jgi:hypothetical protein